MKLKPLIILLPPTKEKNLKMNRSKIIYRTFLLIATLSFRSQWLIAQSENDSTASTQNKQKLSFRDPEDGAIDMSSFLLDHHGLLPVPFIITEPAIGYGGGAALLYFHKQKKNYGRWVPPNITGVAGLGTQNGTWLAGIFHFHVFGADKVRYIGALGKPYINIKYYGNTSEYLSENPVQFNMNAIALAQRVQVRLAETNLFLGLSYVLYSTENTIDTIPNRPIINKILSNLNGRSTISMLQPNINWDSRNNIFTPVTGMLGGVTFDYNATWLGASDDFFKFVAYFFGYQPITSKIFSGWRFDANFMLGDAPLYALPFINLRGVPAMRYQSDNTILVETEWRFNVYKRWSIDAFTGTGKAYPSFSDFGASEWVYNYGAGFRYEMARAFGLHTGMDFAWAKDGDFAFYFIVGSAWGK